MKPTNNRKKHLHSSRGVALVITLLMLLLFTAMTLAMVIATTSDTLINGYYRNYRGAFYAADSGANAARAYMTSLIQSNVTSPYVVFTPPITVGTDASIRTQLISAFGSNNSILGSQTGSWPASFTLDPTVVNGVSYGNTTLTQQCIEPPQYTLTVATTGVVGTTPPTCTSPGTPAAAYKITGYTYYYYYSLGVIGQAFNGQQNKISETGYFNFFIPVTSKAGTTTSFSGWGTLYDKFGLCSAPWVPGTMTGAIFSNDSLNFGDPGQTGTSTKYVFTGTVGIADAQAGYFHTTGRGGSDCQASAASSNSADGTTIAPTFTGGWLTGQPSIPLPQDSFNQERAVLNGNGACMVTPCPAVAQSEMTVLQDVNHNLWPTTGSPSSGVYLPYSTTTSGGVTTNTFTGGGILVQGDAAQVTLTASTSGSGASKHNLQVIAVKQGSTTTTVTIDLTGNTTSVTNGTTTTNIQGIPENLGANPPSEACMLYVNGNISSNVGANSPTGLTGPSSGAAIQNGSALTVTATGTIDITGNLTYSTEPVSLNAADTAVSPAPTNVLGIFTPGGNVELKPTASNQNLEIDASIATVSQGGSGGIQASWNSINQVTIVGGRVQNNALDGSSIQNGRNIWFDQRFAGGGFAPPWFPATTIGTTVTYSATPNPPIVTRLSWVNTTAQ